MSFCKIKMSGETTDRDCFCGDQPALLLQANNVYKQKKSEEISANVLALYKAMRLQEQIQKTPYLDDNTKKNFLYTNGRHMNKTAMLIDELGIDFPKTYANLINDQNTNIILDAMQNRKQHIQKSPFM